MMLMVSQNVTPSMSYFGGSNPYAFNENGVAMLSSVLKSKKAIKINIEIMRSFVKMRNMLDVVQLNEKINKLEKENNKTRECFKETFAAISYLLQQVDPETAYKTKRDLLT